VSNLSDSKTAASLSSMLLNTPWSFKERGSLDSLKVLIGFSSSISIGSQHTSSPLLKPISKLPSSSL
jgi:hypothetical protein